MVNFCTEFCLDSFFKPNQSKPSLKFHMCHVIFPQGCIHSTLHMDGVDFWYR